MHPKPFIRLADGQSLLQKAWLRGAVLPDAAETHTVTNREQRLRTHLMKRHKVKDRGAGITRFPSQQLYTKYGLYKVPTTAGWKTAYA